MDVQKASFMRRIVAHGLPQCLDGASPTLAHCMFADLQACRNVRKAPAIAIPQLNEFTGLGRQFAQRTFERQSLLVPDSLFARRRHRALQLSRGERLAADLPFLGAIAFAQIVQVIEQNLP